MKTKEQTKKQIEIVLCGKTLLIDEENLEEYYTYDEACEAAKKQGKRLLTKEEMEELCELSNRWDSERKGRVFSVLNSDGIAIDVFYPACGYSTNATSTNGFYWSQGGFLHFSSKSEGNLLTAGTDTYGMSVRLVQDV